MRFLRLPRVLEPRDYGGEVTGTVTMVKSDRGDSTEPDRLKRTKDGVVLNPQPHEDPNDPLNWPMWRRDLALAVIGFQSFIIGGMSPLLASAFTEMAEEFDVTESKLAFLVGGFMLALGVGSVFFAPTAVLYGKRFVYLVALVVFFAGALWGGASHSFGTLMGARVLMGIGGSPTESLPSASIAEIYFLHERAYRLGIYTLLMLGGKNIVPMIAGFIINDIGWNWVFWILAIISGMNLTLTYFFVPETFWDRTPKPNKQSLKESERAREARRREHHVDERDAILQRANAELANDDSHLDLADTKIDQLHNNENDLANGVSEAFEKQKSRHVKLAFHGHADADSVSTSSVLAHEGAGEKSFIPPKRPGLIRNSSSQSAHLSRRSSAEIVAQQQFYIRPILDRAQHEPERKSYWRTLNPWSGRFTSDKWWMVALRPFLLYTYPPVLFATFIYAFSVVWLIVISETISTIFSNPPYHFKTTSVGLLYVATFIGGCIGSAIAGKLSDRIVRLMSRHNNGTYEPEFRLVMIIPVLISVTMGMMGFGWSAKAEDHWIVPAVFLGILGFGCSLGSTTAITYVVDSYKMFAAEALVCLNLAKNVFGFLFSLFVPKLLHGEGSKTAFVIFGSIQIFLCLFAVPMYIYGKRTRHWTDCRDVMHYLYVSDETDRSAPGADNEDDELTVTSHQDVKQE